MMPRHARTLGNQCGPRVVRLAVGRPKFRASCYHCRSESLDCLLPRTFQLSVICGDRAGNMLWRRTGRIPPTWLLAFGGYSCAACAAYCLTSLRAQVSRVLWMWLPEAQQCTGLSGSPQEVPFWELPTIEGLGAKRTPRRYHRIPNIREPLNPKSPMLQSKHISRQLTASPA